MILLKILLLWVVLNLFILATFWFFATTVNPLFPRWYKRHICDLDPESIKPAETTPVTRSSVKNVR